MERSTTLLSTTSVEHTTMLWKSSSRNGLHCWIPQRIIGIRHLSQPKPAALNEIDVKWAEKWRQMSPNGDLHPAKHIVKEGAEPFYALSMFPYPSGMLHMGHLRVYTISDVVSRFKRMRGYDVLHPMGWDAFGLPAENAAVERGIDPAIWTTSNIEKMKEQMGLMLADFDWDSEVSTCSQEYYKWTQKIFTLLYEHGLAYQKEAEINWDPVDQTVLANEQVDSEGRSWRSGAIVEKKNLKQWFIKITDYAEALDKDLSTLKEWPDKVKSMQRHWIGMSEGAEITFKSKDSEISVFTTRPDTLFSVQYVALALNHPLVQKAAGEDEELAKFIENDFPENSKDGYLLNMKVSLPIDTNNNKNSTYNIPVYAAPYVLGSYGHGAVMGCPAHDERDSDFWKLHNPSVPVCPTVGHTKVKKASQPGLFTQRGVLYDSSILPNGIADLGAYKGKTSKQAGHEIIKALEAHSSGQHSTQLRLRDWLISRQRYWGAPIPMVHCDSCGTVPVPDEQLPVLLPKVERSHFEKGSPLSKLDSFINTSCPSCGGKAKRETDTMDTFMDSSWYFFRYTDSKNTSLPFAYDKATKHMPIDMYIGGVEHAILHLLYSRFVSKFLADAGLWDGKQFNNEPIKKLVTQGMVHGKTFKDPVNGRFLKPEELDLSNPNDPKLIKSGDSPLISFEKMSKSKYNGADPGECIKKYGADATRAHMLFQASISDVLNWNEEQIQGIDRWLKRVMSLGDSILKREKKVSSSEDFNEDEFQMHNDVVELINKVAKSIEIDLSFNTIISDYMKLTNILVSALKNDSINNDMILDAYKNLLIIMAPVTPAVSEECWEQLHANLGVESKSIFFQQYPELKPLETPYTNYNVFINGKARALFKGLKILVEQPQSEIIEEVTKHGAVEQFLNDSTIKRLILNKGLISILTEKK